MSRECNKINNNNNNDNRERKIKSGSRKEYARCARRSSLSLVAFPPAKIVITFCLTEALLWEGDSCKADYWLKGSIGNEVNK